MGIWKLIAGIISILISGFVTFQSFAAGLFNTLEENGETSGTTGLFVAVLILTGGIVSIVVHRSKGIGGNIGLIVVFSLAALIGFSLHGNYTDLIVWSLWCMINVILAVISLIINSVRSKRNKRTDPIAV